MIRIYDEPDAYLDVGQIPGVAMLETTGLLYVTGTPEAIAAVEALATARGWRTTASTSRDRAAERTLRLEPA